MKVKKSKRKSNKKPKFEFWEVLVIALVSSLIMSLSTGYLVYKNTHNYASSDDKYVNEFIDSYNDIISKYYYDVDKSELIDGAIKGMFSVLTDPYTTYLDENNTDLLQDSLSGKYDGIGVSVFNNEDGNVEVKEVFDNSPASVSGIKGGDVFKSINGNDVLGKTTSEAVNIIKNNENISITIIRENTELIIELKKDNLFVPSVYGKLLDNNIGYMQITKFNDTVYDQFKIEINKLESQGINGLILDLRNNTGGYLAYATNIAEMFLEKGKTIYSLETKEGISKTKDETVEARNYKVVILVNGQSASASEILAAALKYSYGATLVGEKTYGKGKVQKTATLKDGTMYKYTSAKWLTPTGICIDGTGLLPDIEVSNPEDYISGETFEGDLQFERAYNEILK